MVLDLSDRRALDDAPDGDRPGHARSVPSSPLPGVAVAATIVLGTLALRFVAPSVYEPLVAEDGIYEWLTCLAYAASAVLAGVVSWRLRRRDTLLALAFALLAVGCVVVAGEEVSWGERALGFDGPEALVELNRQDEANLHNLLHNRVLHLAYIGIGLYGGLLARRLLPGVVGSHRSRLLAPPRRLAGWFLVPVALFAYVVYADWANPTLGTHLGSWAELGLLDLGRLQEAAEVVLGTGFVLFLAGVRRHLRRTA